MPYETPEETPDVDMDDDFEPVNPQHWLADKPTTEPQDEVETDD